MTLRAEILLLREQAVTALNQSHDYFTYTTAAWRSIQQDVQRNGRTILWNNPNTNSSVTEKDILGLAQRFVEVELAASTLQQFVSVFENFLSDTVRLWLLAFPERISGRQLTGRDIFGMPDKASMIELLIQKELRDMFYDRPANWFADLKKMVKIQSPTVADGEQFAEIKATRDVLVHGQGIANAYYIDKAGTHARAKLGEPLEVPGPYHLESWNLIRKLVENIGTEIADKA